MEWVKKTRSKLRSYTSLIICAIRFLPKATLERKRKWQSKFVCDEGVSRLIYRVSGKYALHEDECWDIFVQNGIGVFLSIFVDPLIIYLGSNKNHHNLCLPSSRTNFLCTSTWERPLSCKNPPILFKNWISSRSRHKTDYFQNHKVDYDAFDSKIHFFRNNSKISWNWKIHENL